MQAEILMFRFAVTEASVEISIKRLRIGILVPSPLVFLRSPVDLDFK